MSFKITDLIKFGIRTNDSQSPADMDSTDIHVHVLRASDNGKTISNKSSLPMWVFIPKGLGVFNFKVAQRGRGRVYVSPATGVELNGVMGVGR